MMSEVKNNDGNPMPLKELEKVPEHVRSMAKMGIEQLSKRRKKHCNYSGCQ